LRLSFFFSACFFTVLAPALNAAEINALSIESEAGQPFLAQYKIYNAQSNTDISCYSLQQSSAPEPIHLEYTTLGGQLGALTLWSHGPISAPLTMTVVDNCQRSSQTFTIQADNSVASSSPALKTTEATPNAHADAANVTTNVISAPNPGVTPPGNSPEPATATPAIPTEAYDALQQQINALQTDFKQLQKKSDTLYASTLAQANILATLKDQLTQLRNENHLLRTLVLTLGLALIASGYFFADWLRRYAAVPKTSKTRDRGKEKISQPASSGPDPQPDSSFRQTQSPPTNPDASQAAHTQPPFQPAARPAYRFKSVPLHANDDVVSPASGPQRLSSQQSTNTVMQDASRFFTHGRINQAIEHLQQHLARHPKCSPWMWLYLLDLLSKEGKQQEFDIVAGDCRKHFNLSVERNPDPKQQGIESYPRIMKALQQTWGTPQVISLIDDLVYNTRLVPRMGFERSVFEELMMLKEIACQTQNLPATQPAATTNSAAETMSDNLRELQKLSGDIYVLAPVDQTPFQYWTDFTFELDEPSTARKSA
jgi:hypothetical protein